MPDVFVSYTTDDRERVTKVVTSLLRLGLDVWFDQRLETGAHWRDEISVRLREAKCVLVCWSKASVQSSWVLWEAANAQFMNKLAPAMLEAASLPHPYGYAEAAHLETWQGEGDHPEWQQLLKAIENLTGRAGLANTELARAEFERRRQDLKSAHFVAGRSGQTAKRILSLDAGGVRTVFTLGVLLHVEELLRRRSPDPETFRLSDYFDLIGGSSFGSFAAARLAMGASVAEVVNEFLHMVPVILHGSHRAAGLKKPSYSPQRIRAAAEGFFGRMTLESDRWRTGVALCAKRLDTGSTWVITNNASSKYWNDPVGEGWRGNKNLPVADLVTASIAYPGSVQPVEVSIGGWERGLFADPAFSGLADPSLQLLTTAILPQHGLVWETGADRLMLVSVGSGMWRTRLAQSRQEAKMAARLIESSRFDTINQNILVLQTVSEFQRGWRLNSEIEDMRMNAPSIKPLLYYQRLDISLEAGAIEALLDESSPHRVQRIVEGLRMPDNVQPRNLERLLMIGRNYAQTQISDDLFPVKFDLDLYAKTVAEPGVTPPG